MTKEIMNKIITHKPSKIYDKAIIYNLKIVSLNTTFYTNIYLPKDRDYICVSLLVLKVSKFLTSDVL